MSILCMRVEKKIIFIHNDYGVFTTHII